MFVEVAFACMNRRGECRAWKAYLEQGSNDAENDDCEDGYNDAGKCEHYLLSIQKLSLIHTMSMHLTPKQQAS